MQWIHLELMHKISPEKTSIFYLKLPTKPKYLCTHKTLYAVIYLILIACIHRYLLNRKILYCHIESFDAWFLTMHPHSLETENRTFMLSLLINVQLSWWENLLCIITTFNLVKTKSFFRIITVYHISSEIVKR